jgi:TetR/AcrR family transcriptional regulator, repressor of fatR-cypB operon
MTDATIERPAERPAPTSIGASPDKRQAILAAALRLIARLGLHAAPMSAVAREAGVAAGTLYLYFPSKEAMINALYLEVLEDRDRGMLGDVAATSEGADVRTGLWAFWHGLARWHLDHPDASSFLQQFKSSAILTDQTRAIEHRKHAEGMMSFQHAVAAGRLRDLSLQVFWALATGPIFMLAQMRDAGEMEITDEVLRSTFDGVCRSVLPEGDVAMGS